MNEYVVFLKSEPGKEMTNVKERVMADEMLKPPFQKIIAAKIFGRGHKSPL